MANDSAYILAIRSAMTQNLARINELYGILKQRPLSGLEYLAAERTLQVTIGACIGIARHWSKALLGYSKTGVYESFEVLAQHQHLTLEALKGWKKIIGLRNVLVHEYLNVNPETVRSVIADGYTAPLFEFAEKGLNWLAANQTAN